MCLQNYTKITVHNYGHITRYLPSTESSPVPISPSSYPVLNLSPLLPGEVGLLFFNSLLYYFVWKEALNVSESKDNWS